MKVAFTCDIDWANEKVINDTINLFNNFGVKCTLFATHKSNTIDRCNRDLFEIGIHPNFNDILLNGKGKKAEQVLEDLIEIYPEALGIRSHSLTTSSRLLNLFKSFDLKYESNQIIPYSTRITPYKCWNGMTIIPFNFEDDVHFTYNKSFDISLIKTFQASDYLIMDFHPIHIYLNTDCEDTYEKSRDHFFSKELSSFKNNSIVGARDLLIRTLNEVKARGLKTYHLKEFLL